MAWRKHGIWEGEGGGFSCQESLLQPPDFMSLSPAPEQGAHPQFQGLQEEAQGTEGKEKPPRSDMSLPHRQESLCWVVQGLADGGNGGGRVSSRISRVKRGPRVELTRLWLPSCALGWLCECGQVVEPSGTLFSSPLWMGLI